MSTVGSLVRFLVKPFTSLGGAVAMLCIMLMLAAPMLEAQKRRSSFGGSRNRSGGGGGSIFGNRNSSRPAPYSGGGYRSTPQRTPSSSPGYSTNRSGSMGGYRSNTTQMKDYTSRYGAPRRQQSQTRYEDGMNRTYVYNSYGGFSDGLMMGYMMGGSSWLWHTPFHPAFYYSRPVVNPMPDGSMQVYPPTFSFATLFFMLILAGVIVFVIYVIIKARRRSRFGAGDMSQSSFG
ncbi:MAG: hypothetical protein JNL32_11455 [Candidatus Kapabacteria bacterium]|nr:hypothetical protein [Candidatus Kapabacteria bacterium]